MKDLQQLVEEGITLGDVPGASLAILQNGKITTAAAGFADMQTRVNVTPDTLFHIGSITKPFTASLIMQLVDTGHINLDDTLQDSLPELDLAQPEMAARITIRQMLCHTCGIDGDRMIDTGSEDDYLERFVTACRGINIIHEPGRFFSYSNTGYIFLGRIIEKITGLSFDKVLKSRLLDPLGLTHAATLPEDMLRERVALGHSRAGDGHAYTLEPLWPRSNTPSGARLAMSARELLLFAKAHMEGCVSGNQERVLSQKAVADMQTRAVEIPLSQRYKAWGLGWMHYDPGEQTIFGHDGGVAGMVALLRILPEHKTAIALMTNGPGYRRLAEHVFGTLLMEIAGVIAFPPMPTATSDLTLDLGNYVGMYQRHGLYVEVTLEADGLKMRAGGDYGDPTARAFEIRPISHDLFVGGQFDAKTEVCPYFFDFDDEGRPNYLHFQERAYRRQGA